MTNTGLFILMEIPGLYRPQARQKGRILSLPVEVIFFYVMLNNRRHDIVTLLLDLLGSHTFSSLQSNYLSFNVVYFSPHSYWYFHCIDQSLIYFDMEVPVWIPIIYFEILISYLIFLWPKKQLTCRFKNDTSERPFVKCQRCDFDF